MSTTQACGEPDWFMKRESERVFGDLNGVYTITNLAPPSDDSNILKATVDGVALQAGDAVLITSNDGPYAWNDQGQMLMSGGYVVGWQQPEECDITLTVDTHTISFKEMDARIRRLEEQVEMWKSAAMTLKEINDEIRHTTKSVDTIDDYDPIAAYERAKKATK